MPRKNRMEIKSWEETRLGDQEDPACPLCDRIVPVGQRDAHHLIPKSKGGKETVTLHRICHRQVHALFTETELARKYHTIAAMLEHPEMQKFVEWVKKKAPSFYDGTRMSKRIRPT